MRAPLEQFEHALRALFDDDANGLLIAQSHADDFGVVDVRLDRIERLKHRRDAALGVPGVRLIDRVLGEEKRLRPVLRGRDRGAQAGDAAADDEHIRDLLRKPRRLKRNEIAALGEGFEHG